MLTRRCNSTAPENKYASWGANRIGFIDLVDFTAREFGIRLNKHEKQWRLIESCAISKLIVAAQDRAHFN